MRPLVGVAASRDLDRSLAGPDPDALVERAAAGMAALLPGAIAAAAAAGRTGPIVVLAGRGANGADAVAALRIHLGLHGSTHAAVILAAEGGGPAARQLARLPAGVERLSAAADPARAARLLDGAALVIEGLAGTGLEGPLRGAAAELAALASAPGPRRVAVDLPAGIGTDGPAFRADETWMVAPLKEIAFRPAFRAACGAIRPVDGVFQGDAGSGSVIRLLVAEDLPDLVPRLAPDDHKGRRGHLSIWAGAVGTSGAAAIACRAAGAAGAGLVRLRARPDVWAPLAARLESELVAPLGEVAEELALAAASEAALAGPGWGSTDPAPAILAGLWAGSRPLVLDADALAPLASPSFGARAAPAVLTPHPGELARLAGLGTKDVLVDPSAASAPVAARLRAVVMLRAATTWIVAPDGSVLVVDGLEPALGTAGSGDALAGLLAGLVARAAAGDPGRLDLFRLAGAAALAHAEAGRLLARERGFFSAAELPPALAAIVHAASTSQAGGRKERA